MSVANRRAGLSEEGPDLQHPKAFQEKDEWNVDLMTFPKTLSF